MRIEVRVYGTEGSEPTDSGAYHLCEDCGHIRPRDVKAWSMTLDVRKGELFDSDRRRWLCGTCHKTFGAAARTFIQTAG